MYKTLEIIANSKKTKGIIMETSLLQVLKQLDLLIHSLLDIRNMKLTWLAVLKPLFVKNALRGEYLFQRDFKQLSIFCKSCSDDIPFYCFGGFKLSPRKGFWRLNVQST